VPRRLSFFSQHSDNLPLLRMVPALTKADSRSNGIPPAPRRGPCWHSCKPSFYSSVVCCKPSASEITVFPCRTMDSRGVFQRPAAVCVVKRGMGPSIPHPLPPLIPFCFLMSSPARRQSFPLRLAMRPARLPLSSLHLLGPSLLQAEGVSSSD